MSSDGRMISSNIRRGFFPFWSAILLLGFVALRFAEPIGDGDLFWQMQYGSQMLANGTLRTDHSLYSWMPASNTVIYCAWTGELLFLGLWKAFGMAGIFAARYAAILTVTGLLVLHARRCGMLVRPVTWLVIMITLLGSVVATLPKPEMLSLVLWNALMFCWFGALRSSNRLPWIYALPAIMLIWVNTHGGFLLAAPFLAINMVAGFFLFPRREALHLAIATGLCAIATVVNPYGIHYPMQLLAFVLGGEAHPDFARNNAFQPTWGPAGMYFHLPELLAWMALGMLAVLWHRSRERWALAVLFAAYVPLYLMYVRSTFLLPAIFAYAVIYLARGEQRAHVSLTVLAALVFLFLGGRALYQAAEYPTPGSWMGFGISDLQPVNEAEFLAQHHFGPRIYNTYNAGGYLLWRLFPRDRVMVDARSFPYTGWYDEVVQFTRANDSAQFRAFLTRHPANVALVDFQDDMSWRFFLATPGWRPAYYGPSAAVFVPANMALGPVQAAPALARLRNGNTATKVFYFAIAVGDYQTAWRVLEQMQGPLRGQVAKYDLQFARNYRKGYLALRAHDYQSAWSDLNRAFEHRSISGQDNTLLMLLQARLRVDPASVQAATLEAGLDHLTAGGRS